MDWSNRSNYDALRYQRRKTELLDILVTTCVQCGSDSNIEFDHIDPSTKEFSVMLRWTSPLSVLLPEIEKCQPLCATCHKEKSSRDGSVDHGSGRSGKRNCKCGPCRLKKNAYMREWKRAKLAA